ncbi:MAG: MarR family winged helix-turn-helix transcriptional regulator [Actinomycetota bacterium]|nr:MarR family winged helix-turn-helix transcriptional regulator [Actinomycetota bacterium]
MSDTRWLDECEARTWRALQFMHLRLSAQLARDLAEHSSLSYQDYVALVALTDQPDGRLRLFELAHAIGWEKSRLSHHVSRMEERGLVQKEKCDQDRRGAFVVVTEAGREAIREAAPSHVAAVRRLFLDAVPYDSLGELAEIFEAVLTRVRAEEKPCPEQEAGSRG